MTIQSLSAFIDQLGYESLALLVPLTLTALLIGLMTKSFLYD